MTKYQRFANIERTIWWGHFLNFFPSSKMTLSCVKLTREQLGQLPWRRQTTTNGEAMGKAVPLSTAGECKLVWALWTSASGFLKMPSSNGHATQQEQRIPHSPTEIDSCMAVCVASLFTGIKECSQTRHPSSSTTKWIVKMWHVQRIETYSAVKESPLRSLRGTWMILSSIILSQVTQSRLEKTKTTRSFSYVVLHF